MQKQITLGGGLCVNWRPEYAIPEDRANYYRHTLGPACGSGVFLILRETLDEIGTNGQTSLVMETDTAKLTLPRVFIHSARRVEWGSNPDAKVAVYAAKVVDVRYQLSEWSFSSRALNVRNFAGGDPDRGYLRETVKSIGVPFTWDEVIRFLWNDCKLLGTYPGLGRVTAPPPEEAILPAQNAWRRLNEMLLLIGRAIAYDCFADKFSIVELKEDGNPPDDLDREFDSRPYSGGACVGPEKITVVFAKKFEDYGTEADTAATGNWLTAQSGYQVDVSTRIPGALPGTIKTLWAPSAAVIAHGSANTITNLAAVNAEAKALAAGWLAANLADVGSRAQVILPGLVSDYMPGPAVKVVIWHAAETTEIVKYPGLPIAAESNGGDSPAPDVAEFLEGVDIGRKSFPNFPRLSNIVQVSNPQFQAGDEIRPESGYHRGYVRRVQAGSLDQLEPCWILFVDDFGTAAGDVTAKNGDFYGPARLSGLRTGPDDERLPLYVCRRGLISSLIPFRMAAELACGGSANAYQIAWDAAAEIWKDIRLIKVFDDQGDRAVRGPTTGGTSSYVAGYRGWAMARGSSAASDPPHFSIVSLDHRAKFIEGQANIVTGTNTYTIFLNRWYDGRKPPTVQINEVEVEDKPDPFGETLFYPRVPLNSFSRIKAQYDPCANKYRVVQAQQLCPDVVTRSYAAFCGSQLDVLIDNTLWDKLDFSPFNLDPSAKPVSVKNPLSLAGSGQDYLYIKWDDAGGFWFIVNVQHYEISYVADIRKSGCKIQQGKKKAWVPKCSDEITYADAVTFVEKVWVADGDMRAASSGVDCGLVVTYGVGCVLESTTEVGNKTVFTMECEAVNIATVLLGDTLYDLRGYITQINLDCLCPAEFLVPIIDLTDCSSSNASS